jgi:cob(I)alamin adenosyltransferase
MKSMVTTGTGDGGTTHTIGGAKLSKSDPIIACCGWLDMLRAQTVIARLNLMEEGPEEYDEITDFLYWLLHCFFVIGTECNDPERKHPEHRKAEIGPQHLQKLEAMQEQLESTLVLPRAFIVAATRFSSAQLDYIATIARTFERHLVELKEAVPAFEATHLLAFANRVGDFYFVLARFLENREHAVVDYSVLEE